MSNIEQIGLRAFAGDPQVMPKAHVHAEIEINFVQQGSIAYRFADQVVHLAPNSFCVFWATVPHQLVLVEPGSRFCWLTLPLTQFLATGISEDFVSSLLRGQLHQSVESGLLGEMFPRWVAEFASGQPELVRASLLEVEALLRRVALRSGRSVVPRSPMGPVENMCQAMSRGYANPLTSKEIADAAGMHPQSAMRLFKKTMGMTIGSYLLKQRLSNVQRLLVETNDPVETVAYASGFQSMSQFYAVFRRELGHSPREHRDQMRGIPRA